MKKTTVVFTLVFTLLLILLLAARIFGQENQAREIFEQGWINYRGSKTLYEKETIAMAIIKISDPHKDWYTVEEVKKLFKEGRWNKDYVITKKQMTRYLKYDASKLEDKMNIYFSSPPSEEGIQFLVLRSPIKSDDMWAYYPALKRNRRLPANDQQDPFMGSTFAHEENRRLMGEVGQIADQFTFSLTKEEAVIGGRRCHTIEVRPDQVKKPDTGYGLRKFYREEKNPVFVRVEYFDKYGNYMKTQKNSNNYLNELGLWRPRLVEMYKEKDKRSTILYWTERKLLEEKELPFGVFTPIYMERHGR